MATALDVVDGDHINRGLLRRQLQAKLLLDGIEEVRCFRYSRLWDFWRMAVELPIFGSERNVAIVLAGNCGLIDDRLVQDKHLKKAGEVIHRPIDQMERQAAGSRRVEEAGEVAFQLRRR